MLTVVTWKWTPAPGYRSSYGPETVNTVARMVKRCYPHPHQVVCVTDDAAGIDPEVGIVPPWDDFARVPSPHGGHNPSCYRRLRLFHPDIGTVFGSRFVSLDLDCVLTGDVTPLWNRPEDFVAWGDTNPLPGSHYNGSMLLLTAGARPQVWRDFDPVLSPQLALRAKCFGSDQGWISYRLGKGEATWTPADGVYSFRNQVQPLKRLPKNARAVFFHGRHDPWDRDVQRQHPWIREYYQ